MFGNTHATIERQLRYTRVTLLLSADGWVEAWALGFVLWGESELNRYARVRAEPQSSICVCVHCEESCKSKR